MPIHNRHVNPDPHPTLRDAVAVTRFWRHVEVRADDQCWTWLGDTHRNGYGIFTWEGRRYGAHELALSFTYGESRIKGLDTCHSCDNPLCCNPAHLRFDTRQGNVDDMHSRGRAPRGETHSAATLSDADVRTIRLRRAAGARQKDLAAQFNISTAYVSDIVNGLCRQEAGGPTGGGSKRTKRYPNSRIERLVNG